MVYVCAVIAYYCNHNPAKEANMRNDKEYETWHHDFVSNAYYRTHDEAADVIKKSLKLLALVAFCWMPAAITHSELHPLLTALAILWVVATLLFALGHLLMGHMMVMGDVRRWCRQNLADRKSTILLMMFPGTLVEKWYRDSISREQQAA